MRRMLVVSLLLWGVPAFASAPDVEIDAAVQARDWKKAVELARALTEREPKEPTNWIRLAVALHGQRQYTEELEALRKAAEAGANPVLIAVRQTRAYARLKQRDPAFAALDKALRYGFAAKPLLEGDPDFEDLRGDARYAAALERADRNARPCAFIAEAKQFDFWAGEWDVTVGGAPAGRSSVQRILKDCVLLENWEDTVGGSGKSFNLYDREQKRWRQTWVDSTGRITDYVGGLEDGQMRFTAMATRPDGKRVHLRMTFTRLDADRVRQLLEQSEDGTRWSTSFDGLYTRRKGTAGQGS